MPGSGNSFPSPSALFDSALANIAESLRHSTVQIRDGPRVAGAGVIWSAGGWIVTNAHVAQRSSPEVILRDGARYRAEVLARDVQRDLAVLFIPAGDLPAAASGPSTEVRVGELAFALGHPYGLTGSLAAGIVHAVGPIEWTAGRRGRAWIQVDIRLAPGNSGGPLADAQGRIIGINTMVAMELGLAVPSREVEQFLRETKSQWKAA